MYCIKCGEKLPDKANFCFSCGEKTNNNIKIEKKSETKKTKIEKEEHKCWYTFAVIGLFAGFTLMFANFIIYDENPDLLADMFIIQNLSLAFSILGMWSNKLKSTSIWGLVINIIQFTIYLNFLFEYGF